MEKDLDLITVILQRAHLPQSAVLAFDATQVWMAQLEIPWVQELFQTSGDSLLIGMTQPPSLPWACKGLS